LNVIPSFFWELLFHLIEQSVEDVLQVLILFCLELLESDRVLLYSERHTLLRVLPVLVILAMSGEKEGESFLKKIKLSRLVRVFRVPSAPCGCLAQREGG
jgi:cytoplasmic FMR1 interacting protein